MAKLTAALRDYSGVFAKLPRLAPGASRAERMKAVVDLLWDAFGLDSGSGPARMSWVGFYEKTAGADEMILLERRDKPACSPIGLHGCCGRSFTARASIVVRDVASLGAGYIACDPKDKSEVVLPCFDASGGAWGVLDIDSYDIGAFDDNDALELERLLVAAGLSIPGRSGPLMHL
jgi:putative methionine-R-sulfoxide reductase with GAF domain